MSLSPQQRTVVITGANEGIGHHLLLALLEDGYRVAGLDIDVGQLRSLGTGYPERIRYYECDVTSDRDVEQAVDEITDEWSRIDILVNNAAIFEYGFFEDRSLEDTRQEFEVNYFGYLRTIGAVLPHMLAQNDGIIHNLSSGVGIVGNPGLSGYASTKGAIEAFSRSLQLELQRTGVYCTIMHPRLANTRSAATIFPASTPGMKGPAYVGRKLADKIESTRSVIYVDWTTNIGLSLAKRFPTIVRKGTRRFLEEREATSTRE